MLSSYFFNHRMIIIVCDVVMPNTIGIISCRNGVLLSLSSIHGGYIQTRNFEILKTTWNQTALL